MSIGEDRNFRILNCLHRAHFGGAQWRVVWMGERLERDGIQTTVLFPANADHEYEQFLANRRFPYIKLKMRYIRGGRRVLDNLRYLLDLPLQIVRIAKAIRAGAFDIVHVNGATNIGPVLAAVLAGRPVLWHWNDTMVPRFVARRLANLLRLPGCWQVVASSAISDRYALDAHLDRFLGVVPPPVMDAASATGPAAVGFGRGDGHLVGFVSNLIQSKGTLEYIETIKRLVDAGDPVRGVMIGGGLADHEGHGEELRSRIASAGLADRISMTGYREDAQTLMREMDALLFCSWSEAAPIVVLQAMLQGTPLVATDVGNVKEIVDGLKVPVVPVGDIDAMVKGVREVLALPAAERHAYAREARARVESVCSLDAVAARHVQCYEHLLNARARHHPVRLSPSRKSR